MRVKDYIQQNWASLNIIELFELHIQTQKREDAENVVKEAIEELSTDLIDQALSKWCKKQMNNYQILLKTDQLAVYWKNRLQTSLKLTNEVWDIENIFLDKEISFERERKARKEVIATLSRIHEDPKAMYPTLYPTQEQDKILFGEKSPCTIIKEYAVKKLKNYKALDNKEKYLVGICANGILDISNEVELSQKSLFSDEEWEIIKKKLSHVPKLRNTKKIGDKIKNITKALATSDLDKAYKKARKLEIDCIGDADECMYSIYAHILTVYRKRGDIFQYKDKKTEGDFLVKLWGEIFEQLYGDEKSYNIWGESISESSKEEMGPTRTKKINGYKIDCRVVNHLHDREIDFINCEAAKNFAPKKIFDDHLKLLLETRCNLDYLIANCPSVEPKYIYMHYIQFSGTKCNISSLRLVDQGLYISEKIGDLDIPSKVSDFNEDAPRWFSLLLSLVKNTRNLEELSKETIFPVDKTFDDIFNPSEEFVSTNPYSSWLRQYFFPPATKDDPLVIPQSLYLSPITVSHPPKKRKTKR